VSIFEGVTLGPITLPTPPETVTLVRMPIALDVLAPIVEALTLAFGEGLVIRTDTGIDGWLVIARPKSQDSGPEPVTGRNTP
jgi:hypothetical protein